MKISDLRAVLARRNNKGIWRAQQDHLSGLRVGEYGTVFYDMSIRDAEFCATAANTYDQLLRIAEAAQYLFGELSINEYAAAHERLRVALQQLKEK